MKPVSAVLNENLPIVQRYIETLLARDAHSRKIESLKSQLTYFEERFLAANKELDVITGELDKAGEVPSVQNPEGVGDSEDHFESYPRI